MILSFAPKNQQVIAFVRLHMWIKQCETVNKITFLLYVTKDKIHTKCTDTNK